MQPNAYLVAIALAALTGCDSGYTYRANLANPASTPSPVLWAYVAPGGAAETVVLVETAARPFPATWRGVSTLKLIVNGAALPLTSGTASGTVVAALPGVAFPAGARYLMTGLPSTQGHYINGAASDSVSDTAMGLIIGDRVEVATVSFTTSAPATLP